MSTVGVLGLSCEVLAALGGRRGFTREPENSKTRTLKGPKRSKIHEKTPRDRENERIVAVEKKLWPKWELATVELAKADHSLRVQGLGFQVLGSRCMLHGAWLFRVQEEGGKFG